MVKLIPDVLAPEIKSNAEKRLFIEFRDHETDRKCVILHSLGIAEHKNNIFGEIDFVAISSEGILCLEVKGGDVSRTSGVWEFTNRYGVRSQKNEGPFQQVQGNMHSLRQYLVKRLGKRDPLVRCQYACAVLMPDCCFEASGTDIVPEILFDAKKTWNIDTVIDYSFTYWRKLCLERHRFEGNRLTDEEIDRLADLLRGDFHFVSSLKIMVDRTAKELCALTDEQYEILESLADNPRTLVSGVAGAGKTLIAAEQTRRAYWEGKKVLYLCFNHNIAKYVESVLEKENVDITATTLHSLMMQICEVEWSPEFDNAWYSEELPKMFLEHEAVSKYDLLVIDEGQDLLKECYLPCIEKLLHNGLHDGNWAIYYDPNQNIFSFDSELKKTLEALKDRSSVASWKLSINCRNTKQIANANILVSNISEQGRTKVTGPQAEYISYTDKNDERDKINGIIRAMKDSGVVGGDFVILSKYTLSNPKNGLGINGLDSDLGTLKYKGQPWRAKKNEVRFSTISAFKGLDSKIVILADVDQFASADSRLVNYVAVSRACAKIYILYDITVEDERQEMIRSGTIHMIGPI